MTGHERAAFERLLKIARSATGQSRRVAPFILAWWNAERLRSGWPTRSQTWFKILAASAALRQQPTIVLL